MNKDKKIRSKSWTMLYYPEDCELCFDGICSILNVMAISGIDCFISPLHNKDYKKDGLPVKPHRHIILKYSYAVTYSRVLADANNLGFVLPPENNARVQSPLSMRLYCCHLTKDCKRAGKPEYPVEDCYFFGKYQIEDFIKDIEKYQKQESSPAQQIAEIYQYCTINRIYLLCDLWDYAINEKPEWLELLSSGGRCRVLVELMCSMRMREKEIVTHNRKINLRDKRK